MSFRWLLLVLPILLVPGCASPPKTPQLWSQKQVEAFGKLARSPAMFSITVTPDKTSGVRFTGGNRMYEGQSAALKLLGSGPAPAPVVSLKPGGPGEFKALIDTSSRHSWLAQKGLKNANIIPMGPPLREARVLHVADNIPGLLCLAPTIRFDTLSMQDGLYYARGAAGPLGAPARGISSPTPDAVLGMETLRAFSFLRFDFPRRMAAIASTKAFETDEAVVIARVPMKDVGGALACDGVIDGEPALIILDTGGDYGFAMQSPPVRPVRQISIGDLVLRDVKAESTELLGVGPVKVAHLGRQKLARFVVTLDFKKKQVVFERPR